MALVWQTVAPEESVMGPCIGLLQRFFLGGICIIHMEKKERRAILQQLSFSHRYIISHHLFL
jgi:hypothetical protein